MALSHKLCITNIFQATEMKGSFRVILHVEECLLRVPTACFQDDVLGYMVGTSNNSVL